MKKQFVGTSQLKTREIAGVVWMKNASKSVDEQLQNNSGSNSFRGNRSQVHIWKSLFLYILHKLWLYEYVGHLMLVKGTFIDKMESQPIFLMNVYPIPNISFELQIWDFMIIGSIIWFAKSLQCIHLFRYCGIWILSEA